MDLTEVGKSREEYLNKGYTVDTSCYPWVAYKGPRFNPTKWVSVLTDTEVKLYQALSAAIETYQYVSMTSYEREVCREEMKFAESVLEEVGKTT